MNDNVTPDDWESQLIDYTMGVMGAEDAAAFEAGIEECRRNVQMARDYGVVTGLMGLAASPGDPPQGHKGRLMSRIQTTPQGQAPSPAAGAVPAAVAVPAPTQPQPAPRAPQADGKVVDLGTYKARRTTPSWTRVALAAAAVIILLMGGWIWNLNNGPNGPVVPPGYTALSLAAQKGYEKVTALALYNPQKTEALLVANGLPQLPAGKAYEFWFLKKGQGTPPDPAGTFSADQTGSATHAANSAVAMSQYAGFAVSEEPASGSSAPTGPIVVAGTYP